MAGLNYGRSYQRHPSDVRKEGVCFEPNIKKWLVRVRQSRNGTKTVSTKSAHDTKEEAEAAFLKWQQ